MKNINLKDPSKRFRAQIVLPHKPNKPVKLAVVGPDDVLDKAKELGVDVTLSKDQLEALSKNPKEAKKFAKSVDYVLAVPQMMAEVGRYLGRYLGPLGKSPNVLPPNANLATMIDRFSRTAKFRLRQNPVIHARVATRDMDDDDIAENIEVVLRDIENRLEQGAQNIKHVHVKTTMGPAVEIGGAEA